MSRPAFELGYEQHCDAMERPADNGRTTPTIEEAKQAGKSAAQRYLKLEAREYPHLPADPYDALRRFTTLEGVDGMAPHTTLADVFCDAYDAEIDAQGGWER